MPALVQGSECGDQPGPPRRPLGGRGPVPAVGRPQRHDWRWPSSHPQEKPPGAVGTAGGDEASTPHTTQQEGAGTATPQEKLAEMPSHTNTHISGIGARTGVAQCSRSSNENSSAHSRSRTRIVSAVLPRLGRPGTRSSNYRLGDRGSSRAVTGNSMAIAGTAMVTGTLALQAKPTPPLCRRGDLSRRAGPGDRPVGGDRRCRLPTTASLATCSANSRANAWRAAVKPDT
jgi:hypothetical protein